MQIEVFSLCDAATADAGKLNILGAFDTIWVERLPAMYPQCAVALRLRFQASEAGEHHIAINVVNNDGKHLLPPMQAKASVNPPPHQQSQSMNLMLHFQGLKFEQTGEYAIDLLLNGQPTLSLPLFVRQRPASPAGPQRPQDTQAGMQS